ncbi:11664_t:CDS:2 [Ambispora gerdemannii]|uniref:11664_t:CDS:1 n=1 Tax=Ambispora gerdemannii TaxID=144530 RepID=A0A9N8Z105_9GLOM|nr:11664_t:CDS:2 [Ambispora gerdemannii]
MTLNFLMQTDDMMFFKNRTEKHLCSAISINSRFLFRKRDKTRNHLLQPTLYTNRQDLTRFRKRVKQHLLWLQSGRRCLKQSQPYFGEEHFEQLRSISSNFIKRSIYSFKRRDECQIVTDSANSVIRDERDDYLDTNKDTSFIPPIYDDCEDILLMNKTDDVILLPAISNESKLQEQEQEQEKLNLLKTKKSDNNDDNVNKFCWVPMKKALKISTNNQLNLRIFEICGLLRNFYHGLKVRHLERSLTAYHYLRETPGLSLLTRSDYRDLINVIVRETPKRERNPRILFDVLDDLKSQGYPIFIDEYNSLLHFIHSSSAHKTGVITRQQIDDAISIFNEMKFQGNIQPSIITFSILIEMAIQGNQIQLAGQLMDEMQKVYRMKPGLFIYTSIFKGYAKVNDLQGLLKTFNELIKSGYKPDITVLNILIKTYIRTDNMQAAMELYKAIANRVKDAISGKEWIRKLPNDKIIKDNIGSSKDDDDNHNNKSHYQKNSQLNNAILIYLNSQTHKQIVQNVTPIISTFHVLISAFIDREDWTKAIEILNEMTEMRVNPTITIYHLFFERIYYELKVQKRSSNRFPIQQWYHQKGVPMLDTLPRSPTDFGPIFDQIYGHLSQNELVRPTLKTHELIALINVC